MGGALIVDHHRYDCLIVGGGGAGLRAALEASGRASTAVISKLYPTRCHTGAAQGGMCAAMGNVEEDNWEWHTYDTVKGGDYLVDQDAAEIMCREAVEAVLDLEHMGLPFNRTEEGFIDQRRFGGHTRNHGKSPVKRACYSADRTGHMILQTLFQQCVKNDVTFFNEWHVLDLILVDGPGGRVCSGLVAYDLKTGGLHVFQAKSVLFATGGFGRLFKITSNAHTLTGDGPAVCLRRGIPLEDMEFFQFHPTGIHGHRHPAQRGRPGRGRDPGQRGGRAVHEALCADHRRPGAPRHRLPGHPHRGPGGPGHRRQGLRLPGPHPPWPGGHRDQAARHRRFRPDVPGVEPITDPVPIQPTAHYAMGGIPTDGPRPGCHRRRRHPGARGCSPPGSAPAFRCTAPTGWGPTRCWTSSCSARGRASGWRSTRLVTEFTDLPDRPHAAVEAEISALLGREAGVRPVTLREELAARMTDDCGVERSEESLTRAAAKIADLQDRYRPGCHRRPLRPATTRTSWRPWSSASCSTWPR